jgi:HK97 family phage major capsid protein
MRLADMLQEQKDAIIGAEALVTRAESENRDMTDRETERYNAHMSRAKALEIGVDEIKAKNTLSGAMLSHPLYGGNASLTAAAERNGANIISTKPGERSIALVKPGESVEASEYRRNFASWLSSTLKMVGGDFPAMEAAAPSGPISVGTTSGWESIGFTVPTEILPYLASYFALDSFGLAGSQIISTDHTRPLNKPVLSAGAALSTYAENAAPTSSQPFGLSGFTFGGQKYARQVLASYESLMNTELPLQGVIFDELLASTSTTLTQAITTSFVSALTAPPGVTGASPLSVTGDGIYDSIIGLRYAVPPRFDSDSNVFMLSRATLAQIRKAKASTSGVPLFDPTSNRILDKPYVLNDYLDAATGAGEGFVAYGNFAEGAFIRRTPVVTRVFLELFAEQGQIGYRSMVWQDAHFLAELAGASQPPTFQPIYYTDVASES